MKKRFVVAVIETEIHFSGTLEEAQKLTKQKLNEMILASDYQYAYSEIFEGDQNPGNFKAVRCYEQKIKEVKSVFYECSKLLKIRKIFLTTEFYNEDAELWESGAFYTYEIGDII